MSRENVRTPPKEGSSEGGDDGSIDHQIPVMAWSIWIDPPIGYDMNGIDFAHPYYTVRIMSIVDPRGFYPPLEVPYTALIQSGAARPDIWDFQMVGVTSGVMPVDPPGLLYYRSMTVIQGAPGLRRTRSRVFTWPQLNPQEQNHIDAGDLGPGNPAFFKVTMDGSGVNGPVIYKYVVITNGNVDPAGPRAMFLQQPFA
jgi:hypothetical protein